MNPKLISRRAWIAILAMSSLHVCEAADLAPVPALHGRLKAGVQNTLGTHGGRLFRSAAQWKAFLETLVGLGMDKPADNPLAAVDFERNMIACVFQYGDEGNNFALRRSGFDGKQAELDLGMSYIIYKKHGEAVYAWKFIALTLPQAESVKTTVSTYHPMNGGPYPTLDKALLEWSVVLGGEGGDVVGDLKGKILPKALVVKPGEDIELTFTLMFAGGTQEKTAIFAEQRESLLVWDGKYSEGYRNHAFLVATPDGKALLLRPKLIDKWEKNAPGLIEINKAKPLVLPAPGEPRQYSLKALGLDTALPGIYRVTGLYMETAAKDGVRGTGKTCWGGEIATNTVAIEVK